MADLKVQVVIAQRSLVRLRRAMRNTAWRMSRLKRQLVVANETSLALLAFVADGGDPQEILAVEEFYGVSHE